jgi:hypothetical protein
MSLDFIPLEFYTPLFYYAMLIVVLIVAAELQFSGYKSSKLGSLFVLLLLLYLGLRPVSGQYFGDMGTYKRHFDLYIIGDPLLVKSDFLFYYLMQLCSHIMTANMFFLTCAALYVLPLYLVCKKWFQGYWFYAFLMLVISFSFWAAGTNGIRNGIAGSLFLLAISRDKRVWQIAMLIIAVNIHKTMLLPALGFVFAQYYNKPKHMIAFWLLCIPLSLIGGGFWEALFASIGFEDDRTGYLIDGNANDDEFSSSGFRWDFLAYSATAVFAGWYFIVKKKFEDKFYFSLFNTYVFANAFWILVIRANFSNRFAYLSWFMMALVIIYPFLKGDLLKNQSKLFAKVLVLYFLFTFVMNVLIVK